MVKRRENSEEMPSKTEKKFTIYQEKHMETEIPVFGTQKPIQYQIKSML